MKVWVVKLLLLFCVGVHCVDSGKVCAGCPVKSSADDKDTRELLDKALAQKYAQSNEEAKIVVTIIEVTKQVVAGIKYDIKYEAKAVKSDKVYTCHTSLVHQPWISKVPQVLSHKCSSVAKRSLPGGPIDVTTKESELVRQLAELGIETLDELDEDDNKRVIANVVSAMKKLVNGIMYDISVEVKSTSCREKEGVNDKCLHDEVGPLKICNLHIYRSFADKSPLNAKVVKSECFPAKKDRALEKNVESVEYNNNLATYAVKKINDAVNSIVVLGLVNILATEHQYESGIHHTSMTLELGNTNCTKRISSSDSNCILLPNMENHMVCTVRVKHDAEKKKLDVDHNFSCQNVKNDLAVANRERRGLIGNTRPLDISVERLSEIKDFINSELNRESNSLFKKSVVKIISGTEQVTSGRNLVLLVEVANTNCLTSENKDIKECSLQVEDRMLCELTIWERPWLMRSDITSKKCDPIKSLDISAELLGVDENDKDLLNFKLFTKKFQRTYKTTGEIKKRFRIFRANMKKAELLQKTEQGTAKYGATMFSDLTGSEFKKHYLGLKKTKSDKIFKQEMAVIPNITLPDEYDWRNYNVVTPVKNQGLCGSCWAFSVTGNIEGQYAIKTGNLVSLSEQELVDCDKYDNGCEGGFFDTAYHAIEDLGGLEGESDYPYSGRDEKCHFDSSEVRVSISSSVNISSNETDMAKWLVANGPISIGLNANAMQFYLGGVSHPLKFLCNPKDLDHGVLIVGYGVHRYPVFKKTLPFWLIKNSWGEQWGLQGYYMLYRGDGSCGVNQAPSSAVL